MTKITNKDLVLFLTNLKSTLTENELVFDFVVKTLNSNIKSENESRKVEESLCLFCKHALFSGRNHTEYLKDF